MPGNLVEAVKKAGVVGAGGAGFPTHIKLDCKVKYVIVNAAECEPLIQVDQQLVEKFPELLIKTLQQVVKEVGAQAGIIAIKSKHQRAVERLKQNLNKYSKFKVHELDNFFPAGDEQVLVYETTGKIIKEGGIPLDVGSVVINVETLLNVHNAVVNNQPVIQKYVTVTGWVKTPGTFKIPVGTQFEVLIDKTGVEIDEYVVIEGGPMMGQVHKTSRSPVIKTTKALIVLPKDHSLVLKLTQDISKSLKLAKSLCCQCRMCTDMCPRYLLGHSIEPHKIMRTISNSIKDYESLTQAFLCSECGVCETYACVMGLSPRKVNQMLKGIFSQNNIKNPFNNQPAKVRRERSFRYIPTGRLMARLGISRIDKKAPLAEEEIEPHQVVLPLSQHFGAPAQPIVKDGDTVKAGALIAEIPKGSLGARIHASISGKVKVFKDRIQITKVGDVS